MEKQKKDEKIYTIKEARELVRIAKREGRTQAISEFKEKLKEELNLMTKGVFFNREQAIKVLCAVENVIEKTAQEMKA